MSAQSLTPNDKLIIGTSSGLQLVDYSIMKKDVFKNADVSNIVDIFNPSNWETGYLNISNGTPQTSIGHVRIKDWVLVRPGKVYKLSEATGKTIQIIQQRIDGSYGGVLSSKYGSTDVTFVVPLTTRSIKMYIDVPLESYNNLSISLKEV